MLAKITVLALSLTACAVAPSVGTTRQALDGAAPREQLMCSSVACVLHDSRDSDGDGFSDMDEVAAGTDPQDANSRPYVEQLIELAGKGVLPSLAIGHSAIIVLPTRRPDGTALFGGRGALPGRWSMVDRLGIDIGRIDLSQGLTILGGGAKGGPALNARGMAWSLIGMASNADPTGAITLAISRTSTSHVAMYSETQKSGGRGYEFGSFHAVLNNGTELDVTYQASPTQVIVSVTDTNRVSGSKTTNETQTTDSAGIRSDHVETTTSSTNGDTTTTTVDKTTSPDGTVATDTTITHTDSSGKETQAPSRCSVLTTSDGKEHRADEHTDTTEMAGDTSSGDDDSDNTAYANPDYAAEAKPSPDMVQTVLAVRGQTVHVIDPSGEGSKDYMLDTRFGQVNKYGPISLYSDPQAQMPLVLHAPVDTYTDYDPNLPQQDPERTGERQRLHVLPALSATLDAPIARHRDG